MRSDRPKRRARGLRMGLIGALAQVKSLVVRKADSNFIYFHGNDLTRVGGLDGQYGSSIERSVENGVKGAQRLKVSTSPTNNGRFLNGVNLFYGNETGGVLLLGSW